ncbi:MAG TPA: hypothetical protein VIS94_06355 [Desulfomonilia bacterium]
MKKVVISLILILAFSSMAYAEEPYFGTDGMKGLSVEQQNMLAEGKIVFSTTDKSKENSLIEAAIIFNQPVEETWNLLAKVEIQDRYLQEIKKIKLTSRNPVKVEFGLKILFVSIWYQCLYQFNKPDYYFDWHLDPAYKNEINQLKGFWKLYPYGNNKTLARYGSNVVVKGVPDFVQGAFKKSGVEKALNATKKFVDSGGTWTYRNK